jgi:type I restriction enzyme S subunit
LFPRLRFKKFDGDWIAVTLESLAEVERGKFSVRPRNDPRYFGGEMPFIQTGDVTGSDVYLKGYTQTLNDDGIRVSKVFPADTILITIAANIGDTTITQYPVACPDSVVAIQPKQDKVNTIFLKNVIDLQKDNLDSQATQNAQKNINLQVLKPLKLIVPSKEEQNKIASFLSAVDEKISQLTQKLELLSQYKQGMMQKLFSQQIRFKADDGSEFGEWETKLIKDIADVKGGKRLPKGYSLINENTGHPYITVSDMNRSYSIDSTNIRYVPLEVVDTIKRYTITDKDIFISVAGTLGIIGKIPTEFNGANLTENADKLTNLKCHQEFLIYLLDSGYLSELIESTATTSAQPKLALYAIEQLEIQIPCLEEQTKIANFLSAIDQKIEVVAQQIKQAKTWKKGLLQQMFI